MKQIKKTLALLLSAVLLMSLLPAAALAAEDDPLTTLDLIMVFYNKPELGLSEKTSSEKMPFTNLDGLTDEQINALGVFKDEGLLVADQEDGSFPIEDTVPRFLPFFFMWYFMGMPEAGESVTLPYKDVDEDAMFYEAFRFLYDRGILTDEDMDADGNFDPLSKLTQAQLDVWMAALDKADSPDSDPTEPAPSDPAPSDPAPTDPTPSDPTPPDSTSGEITPQALAEELHSLGLFQGVDDTGKNFQLDRTATRAQGLVMLIRLLGKEQAALDGSWSHPFQDVHDWADKHVGYAYENDITDGVSNTRYDSDATVTVNMYLTYVLRTLGYSDKEGDFAWDDPYDLAVEAGILPSVVDREQFLRADLVEVSVAALNARLKASEQTLAEKLIAEGVFTQEQYDAATLIHSAHAQWA